MKEENNKGLCIEKQLDLLGENSLKDGGIWRASYTEEDSRCRVLIKEWMEDAGLEVYEDAIGDIFGRVTGENGEETIMVGSHLDTVKNGGKYDGAAGVVIGINVLKDLIVENGMPKKNIEVVGLMEEEGSRYFTGFFGSKAIVGNFSDYELESRDENGITAREAMIHAGYRPDEIGKAKRDDVSAFIELHIEQGPYLEMNNMTIGAVESIVGVKLLRIKVIGQQNHAGTTPMDSRKDPVLAAAEIITKLRLDIREKSKNATFTVGCFEISPGIHNVVAESVEFTIDLRDGDQFILDEMENHIKNTLMRLQDNGFRITIDVECDEKAAKMTEDICDMIYESAEETGNSVIRMNSGAGHDTQVFATRFQTGMIFIPSHNGISHSPYEYTSPADLKSGYQVLKRLLVKMAY